MKHDRVYIIAEIGINHNGELEIAKSLIDIAAAAGCDAVKFQKRDPDICVPEHQKSVLRDTPWGEMTYIDYKHRMEFNAFQFQQIDKYCRSRNIDWSLSVWDKPSALFAKQFELSWVKVPSAMITNKELLKTIKTTYKDSRVMMSTGMSTEKEIIDAYKTLKQQEEPLVIFHCNSAYPAPLEDLNLNAITTLQHMFPTDIIGYSGHEYGLMPTIAATVLGARVIERHITLDRNMWGTDQQASVEPHGLFRLVKYIREMDKVYGNGGIVVTGKEAEVRKKLRG